jgi:hypothetical protein
MLFAKRQSGMEIVARFYHPYEADLARSLLESEGIHAWVFDDQQIRMRWHLAAALGGVKVAVSPVDAARARAVLAEDRSDLLRDIPEQQLPATPQELCVHCGSSSVSRTRIRVDPSMGQWMQTLAFLLSFGVLVPRRRVRIDHQCEACGRSWSRVERG